MKFVQVERKGKVMFKWFPLLLIAVFVYAGLAASSDGEPVAMLLDRVLIAIPMNSDNMLSISVGTAFIIFSFALLFCEVLRAISSNKDATVNHVISVITFLIAFGLFLTRPAYFSIPFLFVVLFALLDVVNGIIIWGIVRKVRSDSR